MNQLGEQTGCLHPVIVPLKEEDGRPETAAVAELRRPAMPLWCCLESGSAGPG